MGKELESLQNQAYEMIRNRIIFAEYTPGTKLGIKELCEDLGLGRTPVRESFLRLQQEDLVESRPQSGTYVSRINMRYCEAARLARECLEREVVVECCAKVTPEDLQVIDEIIARQEKACEDGDMHGLFESDNALHREFFRIAGRPIIWQWLNLTNTHFERFRWLSAITKGVEQGVVLGQHREMRQAIAERDTNYAAFLVTDHLQKSRYDYELIAAEFPEYFEEGSKTF